jgi:phosphatidylserine/phosphatidylglycerophosphate/cardiolipin synthase-like enzyme
LDVIDFLRRSSLILLALLLTVGCDKIANLPTAGTPPVVEGDESAENESPISVYFSQVADKPERNRANPRNIALACANALGTATRTLDVCCHEIDNRVVVEAILQAHLRGVKVRVITETDYLEDLGPKAFAEAGIPVISDNRSALMHNKFAVIDGRSVWTGSFNFTENCAYKNNNSGVFIKSVKVAENYSAWFDWFWMEGHTTAKRRGGPTPNPKVILADGTVVETRLTTFDRMEELPIKIIKEAKKSVKFLAFSFTHKKIAAAMKERARAGIPVVGVFEQRNMTVSVYNDLADEANITVLPDGNSFNMHHKMIIVDDSVVLTGSYNFTQNASGSNDENYVVIHANAAVAKQCVDEFTKVYKAASLKLAQKESNARR